MHNTVLNSSMGIDITTCRVRKGRFDPGRGYISTGIAEIYSSSITRSDIHYRMLATMALLTFLLKCCVMTQQEGIMQDVKTFAGTDQRQLPEYGPYSINVNLSIYILYKELSVYSRVTSYVTLLGTLLVHLIISKPLDGSDSYIIWWYVWVQSFSQ